MSLWDLRASGSLKAHSLLLAASMTVKWCRATGAHEMSKNIPLRPCCWTCQVGCQLGNGLSLEEMFLEFVRTEVFIGVSRKIRQPIRAVPQFLTSASTLSVKSMRIFIQKKKSYSVAVELTKPFLFSVLSTQNSAKLHHKGGSTQYPKACATSSNPPANLLKAWKGRWAFLHEIWCKNSWPSCCRLVIWKEL